MGAAELRHLTGFSSGHPLRLERVPRRAIAPDSPVG